MKKNRSGKRLEKLRKSILGEQAGLSRRRGTGKKKEPDMDSKQSRGLGTRFLRVGTGRLLRFGFLTLAVGTIAINALFLQSERHPAPFFAKNVDTTGKPGQDAGKLTPSNKAVSKAAQKSNAKNLAKKTQDNKKRATGSGRAAAFSSEDRLGVIGFEKPHTTIVSRQRHPVGPARIGALQAGNARKPDRATAPVPGPAKDLIGALIQGKRKAAPRPPGNIPVAGIDPAVRTRVKATQRALLKLGYPINVDGIAGPATRAALEKFQRSNHLPSTGQPERRTLKVLASRAQLSIP